MNLDLFIVILYLAVIMITGIVASSNKKVKNVKEFSLSTRKYGTFVLVATLSAAFIGGGFSTGNAAKVAQIGIGNIIALFGFSLSVILIGKFVVPKIPKLILENNMSSTGEIMRESYGKNAQILTGFFAFMVCSGILGAQISSISYIFNVFLGLKPVHGMIIGMISVLISTSIGGMQSVVATEIIQFVILMIAMPVLLFISVQKTGGVLHIISQVPRENLDIFNKLGPLGLISLFISFAMGESMVPPYGQRLLMGTDLKTTSKATVLSGILSIPFFVITGLVGLVGLVYFQGQQINTNSIMQSMINAVAPPGIRGILIAGTLSIVMSSASSFLNSASVELTNNVLEPIFGQNPQKSVLIARIINILTGVVASVFAITVPNVLDILVYSYSFWSPVVLVPLIFALLGKKSTPQAFYASMFAGVFSVLACSFWGNSTKSYSEIIGISANLIVFCTVNKLQKKSKYL